MVEARLEPLEPEARRVLRAASVFGQVFWSGGVGGAPRRRDAHERRRRRGSTSSSRARSSQRRREGRFPASRELVFRHALVREARVRDAHRRGSPASVTGSPASGSSAPARPTPLVLAEHFERGGDPRARPSPATAPRPRRRSEGNDFAAAARRAPSAASPAARRARRSARSASLEAEATGWRGENAEAEARARRGDRPARRGEPGLGALAAGTTAATAARGQRRRAASSDRRAPLAASSSDNAYAAFAARRRRRASRRSCTAGRHDVAARLLAPSRGARSARRARGEPAAIACDLTARSRDPRMIRRRPRRRASIRSRASAERFEATGDLRARLRRSAASVGYAYIELGAYAEAEELRSARRSPPPSACGLARHRRGARHNLGLSLSRRSAASRKRSPLELAAIAAFAAQGYRRMEGASYLYLALIHEARGRPRRCGRGGASLGGARRRVPRKPGARPERRGASVPRARRVRPVARGVERGVRHPRIARRDRRGRVDAPARARGGARGERRSIQPRFAAIENGARRLLRGHAARIGDPAWRESFLTRIPENARILALAERSVEGTGEE